METVMSNKARNISGKFATKSETPRKIRSVNLTDDAWQWLADVAAQAGVSRNDYLEAMAGGNAPFIETANPQTSPLIETVKSEINTDDADTAQQLNSNVSPLMETELKAELDQARADYAKLLESSILVADNLRRGVRELQARLEVERADREELQKEFDELNKQYLDKVFVAEALQKNSDVDFDCAAKAGELVSELRKEFGKALPKGVTVGKVQKILERGDN